MQKTNFVYRALILFVCLLTGGLVRAQFPVQVVPQLLPPYSLQLSDYYSGTIDKLIVLLTDRDLTRPSLSVHLQISISGQSATITSKPTAYYPAITLDAGMPVRIPGSELAPYFNPDNLDFQGITKAQYLQSGKLPEGFYQFCIQAIETTTGRVVSQSSCAMAWLSLSDPPLLNLPATSTNVVFRDPLNLLFSWTPRNMSSPNSAFSTAYTFQLIEITDTAIDPSAAFQMYPVLYETTVNTTTFLYGPGLPSLLNGKRYAWRVQAHANSNGQELNLYRNSGYSQVNWFLLQDNCLPPQQTSATIQGGGVHITWIPQSQMLGYEVDYRVKGQDDAAWFTQMSTDDSVVLYDVKAGQSYEYRIGGSCSVSGGTTYGDIQGFTVPAQDSIGNPNCGILPNINITNQTPLPALNAGDVFKAGDFPVKVLQTAGQGSYTGNGYVTVPFLGQAMVKVNFSQIGINTDRQLISGVVVTAFDSTMKQVANADTVAALFSTLASIINELTDMTIDEPAADMTGLVNQVRQIAQQNMPGDLKNQMDSALSDLTQAKQAYDTAKAKYDSLPDGPGKDQAKADMDQETKDFNAAQEEVADVQNQQQQMVSAVTDIIVKAIQQLNSDAQQKGNAPASAYGQSQQTLNTTAFAYTTIAASDSAGSTRNIMMIDSSETDLDAGTGSIGAINGFVTSHNNFVSSKVDYILQQYVLALYGQFTGAQKLQLIGQSLKDNGKTLILSINDKLSQGQTSDQIVPYVKDQLALFLTQIIELP